MSDDRSQNPFSKTMGDHAARAAAALDGYAKLEEQMWEHCRTAIDESARLSKEALAYAATTAAQFRKLSIEATKRATDAMFP
jgi:hypothetical protein